MLIHEYLGIDWDQVYGNLHRLDDLFAFGEYIRKWLVRAIEDTGSLDAQQRARSDGAQRTGGYDRARTSGYGQGYRSTGGGGYGGGGMRGGGGGRRR